MHKPTKIIQATILRPLNTKLFVFDIMSSLNYITNIDKNISINNKNIIFKDNLFKTEIKLTN